MFQEAHRSKRRDFIREEESDYSGKQLKSIQTNDAKIADTSDVHVVIITETVVIVQLVGKKKS